jgi:hypothetical protein
LLGVSKTAFCTDFTCYYLMTKPASLLAKQHF